MARGISNAIARPLILDGKAEFNNPILLATRPETLLFIVIMAMLGWVMLRRGVREKVPATMEPELSVSSS